MKKRIKITVIALLMVAVVAFTLCACDVKAAKPADFLSLSAVKAKPSVTSASELNFSGNTVLDSQGGLFLIGKTVDGTDVAVSVYNAESNLTVYNVALTDVSVDLYSTVYFNTDFFSVTNADGIKLYDADGREFASASDKTARVTVFADLIAFDNVCYRVTKDKKISKAFEMSDLKNYPFALLNPRMTTANYYYEITAGRKINAYDKTLKYAGGCVIPGFAVNPYMSVLADGVILVQYSVALADDARDFDYFSNGAKYDLVTKIYNVKKNKYKDIDCDYSFVGVDSVQYIWRNLSSKPKFAAYAVGYEIEDKQLHDSVDEAKYLLLGSDGKVSASVSEAFLGITGAFPLFETNDRYSYTNLANETVLINGKGKAIGELGARVGSNDKYIWTADAIYDYDLNKVLDLKDGDAMTVVDCTSQIVFLRKNVASTGEIEYYLFDGENTRLITGAETLRGDRVTATWDYYCVSSVLGTGMSYRYCSADGTLLTAVGFSLRSIYTSSESAVVILRGLDADGTEKFYRFS